VKNPAANETIIPRLNASQKERQEEGLKALARMITRAYLRDARNNRNDEQYLEIEYQKETAKEKGFDKREPS
jgi:hypothetical protein